MGGIKTSQNVNSHFLSPEVKNVNRGELLYPPHEHKHTLWSPHHISPDRQKKTVFPFLPRVAKLLNRNWMEHTC